MHSNADIKYAIIPEDKKVKFIKKLDILFHDYPSLLVIIYCLYILCGAFIIIGWDTPIPLGISIIIVSVLGIIINFKQMCRTDTILSMITDVIKNKPIQIDNPILDYFCLENNITTFNKENTINPLHETNNV